MLAQLINLYNQQITGKFKCMPEGTSVISLSYIFWTELPYHICTQLIQTQCSMQKRKEKKAYIRS